MAGQARLTVEQIDAALKQAAGNVTYAARALGVSRTTLYRRINASAALQEVLADAREELVDIAESALRKEVLNGNITAIIFTLKTQGKARGYVERQEYSGLNGGEIASQGAAPLAVALPADAVADPFLKAFRDIRDQRHTEYVFHGGRGSTKSSFISLVMIWLIANNPQMHGLAVRHVGNTLRDSVYSQLSWAIDTLGLTDKFKRTISPLKITYLPTGQQIYFRGADDPLKIKSIRPPFGYIGALWFEELDQFRGQEAVRSIEQSAIRVGDVAYIFKSFNPPRTANNWANKYVQIPKATQYCHHSTYLDVPPEWLGKVFLDEAAHLKEINPLAYEHEYLGVANGTGGLVFDNLELRRLEDAEISQFDHVLHGLDFGWFPDPAAYNRCHYDAARMTLYIYDEWRAHKTSNRGIYDALMAKGLGDALLLADSAEPKSIADIRAYGANIRPADKGPESVTYSMKWLQSLKAIVIDPVRCPATAQEFQDYELEQDKDGEFISAYPDRDNHQIDAVRYATNHIWKRRGQ